MSVCETVRVWVESSFCASVPGGVSISAKLSNMMFWEKWHNTEYSMFLSRYFLTFLVFFLCFLFFRLVASSQLFLLLVCRACHKSNFFKFLNWSTKLVHVASSPGCSLSSSANQRKCSINWF